MSPTEERERQQVAEGLMPTTLVMEVGRRFVTTRSKAQRLAFIDWSIGVPEPKTGTLNWKQFPFQPGMYEAVGSETRQVLIQKSTQVGISAMTIRWALYEADRNGRTILYVFPTTDDVYDFSDARIAPMFDVSEYLIQRKGEPFNKGLKRVGVGLVYFRGSESKRKLDSVDADGIAFDEYDTLNQANIPDAERRLSGVLSAGLIRRIGVPSIPDFGINEKFGESDRREWLVRCEACQHLGADKSRGNEPLLTPLGRGWQMVDFWDNLDQERMAIVCAGCGEPLDVANGRWVAQNPDGEWPGFHVSRLIVPGMRLEEIVKASRRRTPFEQTVFYNKDLGQPFVHATARISPEDIKACIREFVMVGGYVGNEPVTMGVDVASERALNVKISAWQSDEVQRTLWIGELEDGDAGLAFDQLALLMDRYGVNMCVVDSQPETRLARAFANRFSGRVYLCNIIGTAKQALSVDEELGSVSIVRTFLLDHLAENVKRQRNLLPLDLPNGYVDQLTSNVRRVEKDELDRVKVYWQKTRDDDYAMGEALNLVAAEMFWVRQQVEGALGEELRPLEDFVQMRRSRVADLDAVDYSPGPDEAEDPSWPGSEEW